MKSKMFLILNLLLILSSFAWAGPQMKLPQHTIDFGYSPQKSLVTGRFWIHSDGSDTLKITDVKPGCGCTKAPLEKNIIPPGDSTYVDITFSTSQYKGKISKSVSISAEGGVITQRVTVISNVQQQDDSTKLLIIEPPILEFAADGKKHEIEFSIENKTAAEIKPQIEFAPEEYLEIKLPQNIKPGEKARGKVKISADVPAGFAKSFTFSIDDLANSRFSIPVKSETAPMSSTPPKEPSKKN